MTGGAQFSLLFALVALVDVAEREEAKESVTNEVADSSNKSASKKTLGDSVASTPETPRRSRRAFASAKRDSDLPDNYEHRRKKSSDGSSCSRRRSSEAAATAVAAAAAAAAVSSPHHSAESSRKSSMSSGGRKRSIAAGAGGGTGKQFAVTFFVNEGEKTRLVDMLHRAKAVISRKVEKVIGRKSAKAAASATTTAETLSSILENWVSQEEEKDRGEERELRELIESQCQQCEDMKAQGQEPPATMPVPNTVVSPVPEEEEEEDTAVVAAVEDDIAVQEMLPGEDNLLKPPKRFQLSRSASPKPELVSSRRSLTPSDMVPRRHFFAALLRDAELYPPALRRPSAHYDEMAQAASSRPASPKLPTQQSRDGSTVPDDVVKKESDKGQEITAKDLSEDRGVSVAQVARDNEEVVASSSSSSSSATTSDFLIEKPDCYEPGPAHAALMPQVVSLRPDLAHIQRPESQTVPVGGVWHPDDPDIEVPLFEDDESKDNKEDKGCEREL